MNYLKNNKYEYVIFDIFETREDDMTVLKATKNYELTLITCNNSNKKRVIVSGGNPVVSKTFRVLRFIIIVSKGRKFNFLKLSFIDQDQT